MGYIDGNNEMNILRFEEYSQIMKSLIDFSSGYRTSIAISGIRGMGKTTLLKDVYNGIEKNYGDMLKAVFIKGSEMAGPEDFVNALCRESGFNYIPDYKHWKDRLNELFMAFSSSSYKYVIIIDDAHFVKNEELLGILRNGYQEKDCILFIYGIDREYLELISSYDKAFYGSFNVIHLQKLSQNQCMRLIDNLIYPEVMDQQMKTQLSMLSDGNPMILEIATLISMTSPKNNTLTDIEKNKNVASLIKSIYSTQISPQAMAILRTIATGEAEKITQISNKLCISTAGVVSQIKRLVDKGLVSKQEDGTYKAANYIKLMFI